MKVLPYLLSKDKIVKSPNNRTARKIFVYISKPWCYPIVAQGNKISWRGMYGEHFI